MRSRTPARGRPTSRSPALSRWRAREVNELVAALERKFGRKLHAQVAVDPSLIGGVSVKVGDEVLDTSVRARLAAMQAALTA